MFIAINNKGNYQEFPYAKTAKEAQIELNAMLAPEVIEAEEWEVTTDDNSMEAEYQHIITDYDPYYQPEGVELNLTPEGMIYNLQNIRQDLNSDETTLIEAIDKFLETYGGLK